MKISVLVLAMVMMLSVVTAQAIETCCPPVVTCPKVEVECKCPDTKDCPTLEAVCQCDCGKVELPGLYEVAIKGRKRCGTVTVVGAGVIVDQESGKPDYFLFNMIRRFEAVESCE